MDIQPPVNGVDKTVVNETMAMIEKKMHSPLLNGSFFSLISIPPPFQILFRIFQEYIP
jgi:hypothetical protein